MGYDDVIKTATFADSYALAAQLVNLNYTEREDFLEKLVLKLAKSPLMNPHIGPVHWDKLDDAVCAKTAMYLRAVEDTLILPSRESPLAPTAAILAAAQAAWRLHEKLPVKGKEILQAEKLGTSFANQNLFWKTRDLLFNKVAQSWRLEYIEDSVAYYQFGLLVKAMKGDFARVAVEAIRNHDALASHRRVATAMQVLEHERGSEDSYITACLDSLKLMWVKKLKYPELAQYVASSQAESKKPAGITT